MDCIDIVTAKLNDFTQVFKDLIIFMRKEENTHKGGVSLRYCMSSFDTFSFEQTIAEKMFLKELLIRNEITHDYFGSITFPVGSGIPNIILTAYIE